ncbi:zinc finger MYM-type protein 1 [Biomphalaria glabrata]
MLQSVQLNIVVALHHISSLIGMIKNQLCHAEDTSGMAFLSKMRLLTVADKHGIEFVLRRISSRQSRSDTPSKTTNLDFWSFYRIRLNITYLDGFLSSFASCFSSNNNALFNLFCLHPKMMQELQR